jgi:hypothetical protein
LEHHSIGFNEKKNINVGGLHFNVKELNVLVQSLEVSTEERSKGRLCVMRERERERERGERKFE